MRIFLASKSPRRKQLLEQLGYEIEVVHQDVAEDFPEDLPVAQVPAFIAEKKARAVAHLLQNPDDLIIAADTIVALNGQIYHKPTDFNDGMRILGDLQGQTHQVHTGIYFLTHSHSQSKTDSADVTFAPMSEEERATYLSVYKPYDKAGAYGVQDWIGLAKIQKFNGSFATVMGLPTHLVYEFIESLPKPRR